MTGGEIKVRVDSFTPSIASEFSTAWAQFSRSIDSASSALRADIAALGDDGFSGLFPDRVREAHQSYLNCSSIFVKAVGSPTGKLDGFADTLGSVQGRFALISMFDPDIALQKVPGVSLPKPNPALTALMESTYSPAVLDAGTGLPVIPGPLGIGGGAGGVAETPAAGGGFGTGSPQDMGGDPGAGSAATGAGEGANSQSADPTSPGSDSQAGPDGGGAKGGEPTGGAPGRGGAADGAAISQAGLSPTADSAQSSGGGSPSGRGIAPGGAAGTGGGAVPLAGPMGGGPATGGGGGSGFGGRSAGGAASAGAPGGVASGSGSNAPGSGKAGVPRGPGMGAAGEGGANNSAMGGRRGMSGGMMGGASRGHGEEDDAYSPAEFLTTIDNGDKLIGPLPRVVHPVIGVWAGR